MKKLVQASVSTAANRLGTVLLFIGVSPFILYILDYIDVIRPDEDPQEFGLILMAIAPIAIGIMLLKGEGDSISEAFLSWFKNRS